MSEKKATRITAEKTMRKVSSKILSLSSVNLRAMVFSPLI